MQQTVQRAATGHHQVRARLRRALLMLAASAGLALGAAACGGTPASPAASSSATRISGAGGGSGPVTIPGGGGSGGSGQRTSTAFSLAFAKCMRAHGVPDFPDPNGQGAQIGPSSGIDPSSPQFQAALNGPCKSLAPPGWLSTGTGPVTR